MRPRRLMAYLARQHQSAREHVERALAFQGPSHKKSSRRPRPRNLSITQRRRRLTLAVRSKASTSVLHRRARAGHHPPPRSRRRPPSRQAAKLLNLGSTPSDREAKGSNQSSPTAPRSSPEAGFSMPPRRASGRSSSRASRRPSARTARRAPADLQAALVQARRHPDEVVCAAGSGSRRTKSATCRGAGPVVSGAPPPGDPAARTKILASVSRFRETKSAGASPSGCTAAGQTTSVRQRSRAKARLRRTR